MFEETPIWTLIRILFMQAVGMQAYFAYNALGNKELYPNYTNVSNPALATKLPTNRSLFTKYASITRPIRPCSRRSKRKKLSCPTLASLL